MHGESSGLFALPSPNETSTHPPCRSPGANEGSVLPPGSGSSPLGPALGASLNVLLGPEALGVREKSQESAGKAAVMLFGLGKREAILAAGFELFATRGFENASVEDIQQ